MNFLNKDPVNLPFNEWLMKNGVWLAVGVAAVIILVVGILFLMSLTKKK